MERPVSASGLRSMMLLAPVAHATAVFVSASGLMTQHQTKMLNNDKRPCFIPLNLPQDQRRATQKLPGPSGPGSRELYSKPEGDHNWTEIVLALWARDPVSIQAPIGESEIAALLSRNRLICDNDLLPNREILR